MSNRKQWTAPSLWARLDSARLFLKGHSPLSLALGVSLALSPLLASSGFADSPFYVARKIAPRAYGSAPAQPVKPTALSQAQPSNSAKTVPTIVPQLDQVWHPPKPNGMDGTLAPVEPTSPPQNVTPSGSTQPSVQPASPINAQVRMSAQTAKLKQTSTEPNQSQRVYESASDTATLPVTPIQPKLVKSAGKTANTMTNIPASPSTKALELQEARVLPAEPANEQSLGQTQANNPSSGTTIPAEKPAKNKHEKKAHPVVIAPEPLLPAPDSTQPAANGGMNWAITNPNGQTGSVSKGSVSATSNAVSPASRATSPEMMVTTSATKTVSPETPVAHNGLSNKENKTPNSSPGLTPAVNHTANQNARPMPATSSRSAMAHHPSKIHTLEPGFYPVGFTPAVLPVNPMKMQALAKAISHYNKGIYYAQRKQWDDAIDEYKQVLAQNLNLADAFVGLSTASIYKRDWETALKSSQQALKLKKGFIDPANITQARYNLSAVYCISDDYRRALKYYKEVKKANHSETDNLWAFLQNNCHTTK